MAQLVQQVGGIITSGEVPEWLNGADCKSVALQLRRFESYPPHLLLRGSVGPLLFVDVPTEPLRIGWLGSIKAKT
jgi:hypothetical protein